jgi:hypothetical protein
MSGRKAFFRYNLTVFNVVTETYYPGNVPVTILRYSSDKYKEVHMQMSQVKAQQDSNIARVQGSTCPHDAGAGTFCSASIMTVVLSSYQKTTYCWTENYDSCPMFLAKILRGC